MMNRQALRIWTLVLATGFASHAQETTNALATEASAVALEKPQSSFGLTVSLSQSSNLYKESSPDHQAWTDLTLLPSYKLNEDWSLSLKSIVTQEQTQARNTLLSNTTVKVKRKIGSLGGMASSLSAHGILPTDEQDYKKTRFQGGVGMGAGLDGQWGRVHALYGVSLTRNFHEYNFGADRSSLAQYSLSQSLETELELISKWSLSASAIFKVGRSYQNTQKQAYALEADLNYAFSEKLQASVGISNEGAAFKANGTTTNIDLYNENTSVILAGITFVN